MSRPGVVEAAHRMSDERLLERVLGCYKPHCRYLLSMSMRTDGPAAGGVARFAIPQSCYIDDTGHLNSVEVNICYNQMLYFAIAVSVRDRVGPVFAAWSMADFWRRQLPDILIAEFSCRFPRPMDPRNFSGEFTVGELVQRRLRADAPPLIVLDTSFRYWDEHGGSSAGTARVAIVSGSVSGSVSG